MEWRFYGPLLLAVVMFLLVGTIIERRIEIAIRRIMEQRRVMLQEAEHANHDVTNATTMTSSQRNVAACRTQSSPTVNNQQKVLKT
ncbi:hypothetical protein O3G_MSEX002416 [Manduca sexta]|uniref:Uncharacterized protein n=1 Tax=Manduca sexta TaxID=7130 RepID=A0A921YPW3_MANSE|nr:hypothetical protein O3G_MSEX002416 [Manduca sexta]